MNIRALLAALFLGPLLVGALASPTQAADNTKRETIRIYHEPVSPIAVSGSGIGEVRTFLIPMAVDGVAGDGQYLSGTLTTLATNMLGGQELRASNLIFVFGAEEDQIVVGGVSLYPPAGATLAPGTKTVRPVVGGSGKYDGARGQVISRNYGPDGWTHTFRVSVLR